MNQLLKTITTNNLSNDADHLASQLIILRMKKVDKAGQRGNKTPHREFVMHLKIFFVSIFAKTKRQHKVTQIRQVIPKCLNNSVSKLA